MIVITGADYHSQFQCLARLCRIVDVMVARSKANCAVSSNHSPDSPHCPVDKMNGAAPSLVASILETESLPQIRADDIQQRYPERREICTSPSTLHCGDRLIVEGRSRVPLHLGWRERSPGMRRTASRARSAGTYKQRSMKRLASWWGWEAVVKGSGFVAITPLPHCARVDDGVLVLGRESAFAGVAVRTWKFAMLRAGEGVGKRSHDAGITKDMSANDEGNRVTGRLQAMCHLMSIASHHIAEDSVYFTAAAMDQSGSFLIMHQWIRVTEAWMAQSWGSEFCSVQQTTAFYDELDAAVFFFGGMVMMLMHCAEQDFEVGLGFPVTRSNALTPAQHTRRLHSMCSLPKCLNVTSHEARQVRMMTETWTEAGRFWLGKLENRPTAGQVCSLNQVLSHVCGLRTEGLSQNETRRNPKQRHKRFCRTGQPWHSIKIRSQPRPYHAVHLLQMSAKLSPPTLAGPNPPTRALSTLSTPSTTTQPRLAPCYITFTFTSRLEHPIAPIREAEPNTSVRHPPLRPSIEAMARRRPTISSPPSCSSSSSSEDERPESPELPSPRKQCRGIVRKIDAGDSDSGLAKFRKWWKLVANGARNATSEMKELMDVKTCDKVQKAITAEIKDKKTLQCARALERSDFWNLSVFDVWGLFGSSGATSRTFLDKLNALAADFENAEDALALMGEARETRMKVSKSKYEWKPQDLDMALNMKRKQDANKARNLTSGQEDTRGSGKSHDAEQATSASNSDADTDEESDDPNTQDGAKARTSRDHRAPGTNTAPTTPKQLPLPNSKAKRRRRFSDISPLSRSIERGRGLHQQHSSRSSLSIERGRRLRQPRRSSLSPALDFSLPNFLNPKTRTTHQGTPKLGAGPTDSELLSSLSPASSEPDAAPFFQFDGTPCRSSRRPSSASTSSEHGSPGMASVTQSSSLGAGPASASNPTTQGSTNMASATQPKALSKRPRRDSSDFVQDSNRLDPSRHLAIPHTEPLTLDHLGSWIAVLSTILEPHTSLRRCTVSDITEWIQNASPAAGSQHIIVIQDQALEQIPVVFVDRSPHHARTNIYADDDSFRILQSALTAHVPNVSHKAPPTMRSEDVVTAHGLEASILSACVITGVLGMQTRKLATKLERMIPAVWGRAIRVAHEFRAGSPTTQQAVLDRCRIADLPNSSWTINPATLSLPGPSTTHVELLHHFFENTTLSAFRKSQNLSTEWTLVADNSRLVVIIAAEVLKNLAVSAASPDAPAERQKLQQELEGLHSECR
ncbi:uncharacterized protein MYCFIDRAFT_179777 [Pseudocercospora fijiensis CIRAD86]|uniref:Uncharacterized protein n=1 Tax=Pseudocercospora fijiensis (strain CIRAD86) TaxID=383855 RepID=M2YIC5_PSEFD|nr:uncharacterized protein MYCFIDRAFT_179777 [Pseudocercospora fijiensis CIRAD86]EME77525.1 hypothetical protein MYCFIDRAFT_179777 [Pseudocercospora fijiensis CIRAD86]